MKVFIENEAGSKIKNEHNEKTLEFIRSYEIAVPYPFPYGFFLQTTAGDGDNLDCFVITEKPLKRGEIVEVEPLEVMEVIDTGEIDHKVISGLTHETQVNITGEIRSVLSEFTLKVFSNIPGKHMQIGKFLPKEQAVELINKTTDK